MLIQTGRVQAITVIQTDPAAMRTAEAVLQTDPKQITPIAIAAESLLQLSIEVVMQTGLQLL